jgi:glycosyltransferase involved in cell wall biosynthesis
MKIALFAGSMKPGHDGVTRVLYKLSEFLQKENVEHIFFSPIIPPPEEQSVPMIRVPSVQFPLYNDYRLSIPGQKMIDSVLREFKPDVLHINSPCSLGYAAIAYGKKHRIPVVATYHTHFASYARYYKIKMLEQVSWSYFKHLYNNCERIFVPSMPILDELREHGLRTLAFLPHGVDTNVFSPRFGDENWKATIGIEGKKALLFAGRLVWEKDLKTLAETYSIINAKRNDAVFVLAGDGPVRKELEELMPEAVFLGHLSSEELSRAYASSDMFVFPSTTETFGNVTLEAMAAGLPPVCANKGGASGIIKEGVTGLLAEPRNAHDLAEKIGMLLDSSEQRENMARTAYTYAQNQTWEKIFSREMEEYQDVIRKYKLKRTIDEKIRRTGFSALHINCNLLRGASDRRLPRM